VTPEQIVLVERSLERLTPSLERVAEAFYRRLFAADPSIRELFSGDPASQRALFAIELGEIVHSIRRHDTFVQRTGALGERHRRYGVRAGHYRTVGAALMAALAGELGEGWTPAVGEAWRLAYNLTAEAMMAGGAAGVGR
jgi:hemoglobin-like flavoprotein